MENTIESQNIIAAAIFIQFFYIIISVIGLFFIEDKTKISLLFVFYFVVSLIVLLLSNPFLVLTKPLIPIGWSLSQSSSLFLVFLTNIIFLSLIIMKTGHVLRSIYTNTLTVLPALSIFLKEPVWRIFLYIFIISLFYFFSSLVSGYHSDFNNYRIRNEGIHKMGFVVINILSLILSAIIGLLTK